MNHMLKLTSLFLFLCIIPAAYSQGNCSFQTAVGTYAMYERGFSFALDPTQQPYPVHFGGATAPFANVGLVTFKPNGIGDGYYWIYAGLINGGFQSIPVHITITEMNADCTGKFSYVASLPGGLSATVEERMILFNNGDEFRTIPTSIQNGIGTLAWIGTGHRISKSANPVRSCGQQIARGTYVMNIENIIMDQPTKAIADTVLIRQDISMTGEYKGAMYEKYADLPAVETWVEGKMTVNPDCSFTSIVQIPQYSVNLLGKGVFFNQGKEFYMIIPGDPTVPMDQQWLMYSLAFGKRIY